MGKRPAWNGLCSSGKHGLDHEGQHCDLCPPDLLALGTEMAGALEDLIAVAQSAMREANGDGAGWIVDGELRPARELVARWRAATGAAKGAKP